MPNLCSYSIGKRIAPASPIAGLNMNPAFPISLASIYHFCLRRLIGQWISAVISVHHSLWHHNDSPHWICSCHYWRPWAISATLPCGFTLSDYLNLSPFHLKSPTYMACISGTGLPNPQDFIPVSHWNYPRA